MDYIEDWIKYIKANYVPDERTLNLIGVLEKLRGFGIDNKGATKYISVREI